MGKAYWSKSMVVSRLTGLPYRLNDLVMSAANGRVLIRSLSACDMTINEDSFVQVQCHPDGRLLLRVLDDKRHLLKQHPRYVKGKDKNEKIKDKSEKEDKSQRNMYLYARQQVRQACKRFGVKELRCKIVSAVRVSDKEVVAELRKVEDMAEMYGWGSRCKK